MFSPSYSRSDTQRTGQTTLLKGACGTRTLYLLLAKQALHVGTRTIFGLSDHWDLGSPTFCFHFGGCPTLKKPRFPWSFLSLS